MDETDEYLGNIFRHAPMAVQLTMRENGHNESFHGKFREECLNEQWFLALDDARETIESWRIDYNQVRPHSALGYLTPLEFATGCCELNLELNSNPIALTCPD